MPTHSQPWFSAVITTPRITAFNPGASPPPVVMAILRIRGLRAVGMASSGPYTGWMTRILLSAGTAFVLLALAATAHAQQWSPSQPIRVIVPYAPVGTSDIIARVMSDRVKDRLGQPFVIENRP